MNKYFQKIKRNSGMTYVELIVVLAIFSLLSTVVIYNYGKFQSNVDIRNLASDIALQVVQAQTSSLNGASPGRATVANWKPSYWVHFSRLKPPAVIPDGLGGDYMHFTYFADLSGDGSLQANGDPTNCTSGECLNRIEITKGNSIDKIDIIGSCGSIDMSPPDLNIFFVRPNSGATMRSSGNVLSGTGAICNPLNYVQITVMSPNGTTGKILLYPSGRVQIQ